MTLKTPAIRVILFTIRPASGLSVKQKGELFRGIDCRTFPSDASLIARVMSAGS